MRSEWQVNKQNAKQLHFFKKENYNLSCKIFKTFGLSFHLPFLLGKQYAPFYDFGKKKPKAKIIFSQERCYRPKNKQTKNPLNRNRDSSRT